MKRAYTTEHKIKLPNPHIRGEQVSHPNIADSKLEKTHLSAEWPTPISLRVQFVVWELRFGLNVEVKNPTHSTVIWVVKWLDASPSSPKSVLDPSLMASFLTKLMDFCIFSKNLFPVSYLVCFVFVGTTLYYVEMIDQEKLIYLTINVL